MLIANRSIKPSRNVSSSRSPIFPSKRSISSR